MLKAYNNYVTNVQPYTVVKSDNTIYACEDKIQF